MAEYMDLLKRTKRMCGDYFEATDGSCCGCPLNEESLCRDAPAFQHFTAEELKKVEQLVLEFEAEYPEPVYPTWAEWLLEIGGGEKKHIETGGYSGNTWVTDYETFVVALDSTIPDNTTRMLGVKPKEG